MKTLLMIICAHGGGPLAPLTQNLPVGTLHEIFSIYFP